MATDTEQLILSISADISQVKRALKRLEGDAAETGNKVKKAFDFDGSRSMRALQNDAKNLTFQLNDITQGLLSGQSPFQVMIQQGSQVSQVLTGAGGISNAAKLLGSSFLGLINPISLVTSALIFGLGMVVQYFTATEDGAKESEEALKKEQAAIDAAVEKWAELLPTLSAVRAARKQALETGQVRAGTEQEIQRQFSGVTEQIEAIIPAFTKIKNALREINNEEADAAVKDFNSAIAELLRKSKDGTATIEDVDAIFDALSDTLRKAVNPEVAAMADNLDKVRQPLSDAAAGAAKMRAEAELASEKQKIFNKALEDLRKIAKGHLSDAEKLIELYNTAINAMGQLDDKQRELMQRRLLPDFLAAQGPEVSAEQAGAAVDIASGLLGQGQAAPGNINAFLKAGGVDLNAATTAWCAAFVNSALAQVGIKGSGSNVATDFAKWGVHVAPTDVVKGDILVESRGRQPGQTGGHVGFATGALREVNGEMQALILSGNQNNKVTETWINLSDVAVRRATDGMRLTEEQLKGIQDGIRHETQVRTEAERAAEKQRNEAERLAEQQAKALEQLNAMVLTEERKIALDEKINEINRDRKTTEDEKALAITRVTAEAAKEAEVEKLLAQAKEAGKTIDAELIAQYNALAQARVNAIIQDKEIAVANRLAADAEKQRVDALKQLNQQAQQMVSGAITGFIQDLRNGVDAGEAFNNMLNRIIDSLINMAVQMAVQSLFNPAGAGGGGLIGQILGMQSGGIVGRDGTPRRVDPRVFIGAPRMASGGLVGGEVPIIAHRGEMVIPKNMVGRGGSNTQINTSLGDVKIDMSQTGMVTASNKDAKQFGLNVQKMIQIEMVRESRPGGLLRRVPT